MKYKYILSVFAAIGILFSPFLARHTEALDNDEFLLDRSTEVTSFEGDIVYENTSKQVSFSFEKLDVDNKNKVVSIFVDPKDNSINAISVKIKYSKEELKPVIIDNTNSDFSLFFVEDINELEGIITITYIEPFPGINKKAKVADILFKKINDNQSEISIENDSEVLANDGFGTQLFWVGRGLEL